jgi:hypothetical protein
MPIRFRCPRCSRLLGIARRKIGAQTACPQCGETITVPNPEEPLDLTPLLESENGAAPAHVATAPPPPKAAPAPAPPRPAAKPQPQPRRTHPGDDPPLFEGEDFEALLGVKQPAEPLELDDEPAKSAAGGVDAMSLADEPRPLVLTPQKATLLVAVVVVLLGVAFALGFLIASRS